MFDESSDEDEASAPRVDEAAEARDDAAAAPKDVAAPTPPKAEALTTALPSAFAVLQRDVPSFIKRKVDKIVDEVDVPPASRTAVAGAAFSSQRAQSLAEQEREGLLHAAQCKASMDVVRARQNERQEEKAQKPAYERESMHGQKIAISVGPCSLPATMRTTYSEIPSKKAKFRGDI
ncbi:hypothetical protein M885DRAFT_523166 [Pelagophyceae sp. CCMP2097]|nr:hypothetical protein M885DRAFT_523166 [Pelagophyceae sp. CCMP2097]